MSDEIAIKYVALEQTENGWSVYRVRRGNWHDRIRGELTEVEALALVDELEAKRV